MTRHTAALSGDTDTHAFPALLSRHQQWFHEASQTCALVSQSPEAEDSGNAGDQGALKDDNEGFKDTIRGIRRSRNLKTSRKPELDLTSERPNGVLKPNSRCAITNMRYSVPVSPSTKP